MTRPTSVLQEKKRFQLQPGFRRNFNNLKLASQYNSPLYQHEVNHLVCFLCRQYCAVCTSTYVDLVFSLHADHCVVCCYMRVQANKANDNNSRVRLTSNGLLSTCTWRRWQLAGGSEARLIRRSVWSVSVTLKLFFWRCNFLCRFSTRLPVFSVQVTSVQQ